VNELETRDTDSNASVNFTHAYDAAGNMTDDGEDYEYVYDAFYRLRQVKDQSSTLLAEYRYNGLGHMIMVHEDTNASGGIDGSDVTFYPAYDEGWREVARYRAGDTSPKEQFVNATAGLDGYGRSSYINDVVLRDRDNTSGWLAASDGTLEERYYYCPNWRGDVSALVHHQRYMAEWVKYSPYGIPFGLPGGDSNSDGDNDAGDATQIQAWIDAPAYDVRGDVDLDGDVDGTDKAVAQGVPLVGSMLGWLRLGEEALGNRRAWAGYESAPIQDSQHVRSRFHESTFGRWAQRDPLEYVDGFGLYSYVDSDPVKFTDPLGLLLFKAVEESWCEMICRLNPTFLGATKCKNGDAVTCICHKAIDAALGDGNSTEAHDAVAGAVQAHEDAHAAGLFCIGSRGWRGCDERCAHDATVEWWRTNRPCDTDECREATEDIMCASCGGASEQVKYGAFCTFACGTGG
jgi:RHS repeat-associated protein